MPRQGFIDWMKAIGMLLIVIGHVVGSPYNLFNLVSQPIYTKQLGVCLFIFVMGWSLAHEHSTSFKVVFKRVFPIYFYGIIFALLLSSIFIFTKGDINESNYMPFILGVNVLFNYFPANPTTWYIGTYLHILLFWFFFIRGKPITKTHVIMGFMSEWIIRGALLHINQDFIAYMTLPNWLTVFLLGGYLFSKTDTRWQAKAVAIILLWSFALGVWASPWNTFFMNSKMPFRELSMSAEAGALWLNPLYSLLISLIYSVNTFVLFELLRRLPKFKVVEFFARNSLITFIIHMPLIYALDGVVYGWFDDVWARKLSLILIIFIGCALVSEFLQNRINVKYLQTKAWEVSEKVFAHIIHARRG
jgi:fucose 4-O-acetylase-like acetyltransferase